MNNRDGIAGPPSNFPDPGPADNDSFDKQKPAPQAKDNDAVLGPGEKLEDRIDTAP